MTAPTISRVQAIRNARAVLDRALDRIARDRAEGRLDPAAVDRLRLAEARYARRRRQQPVRHAA